MIKEYCSICTGTTAKIEAKQKQYKAEREYRIKYNKQRKRLQEDSRFFASKHNDEWTDEDLKRIIVRTAGIDLQKDIDVLFVLAKELRRTLSAIEWVYIMAWREDVSKLIKNDKENARYNRIQTFKTQLGL